MPTVESVWAGLSKVFPREAEDPFAPVITAQPVAWSGSQGDTISMFVTATSPDGSPITYQWFYGSGTAVIGQTTATLSIPADYTDNNGKNYYCVLTNDTGPTASQSALVTVAVPPAPVVTVAPIAPNVVYGTVINFVATASGYGALTYQWLLDGSSISGATSSTYNRTTVLSDNGRLITCAVTDSVAQTSNASPATMTVTDPAQPFDDAVIGTNPDFYYPCRVEEAVFPDYKYTDRIQGFVMQGTNKSGVAAIFPAQFGLGGTSVSCDTPDERPLTTGMPTNNIAGPRTYQFTFRMRDTQARASICGSSNGQPQPNSTFFYRGVIVGYNFNGQLDNAIAAVTPRNSSANIGLRITPAGDSDHLCHLVQRGYAGQLLVYFNGVFAGAVSDPTYTSYYHYNMMIGSTLNPVGHLATWGRELSAAEITAIWNALP